MTQTSARHRLIHVLPVSVRVLRQRPGCLVCNQPTRVQVVGAVDFNGGSGCWPAGLSGRRYCLVGCWHMGLGASLLIGHSLSMTISVAPEAVVDSEGRRSRVSLACRRVRQENDAAGERFCVFQIPCARCCGAEQGYAAAQRDRVDLELDLVDLR